MSQDVPKLMTRHEAAAQGRDEMTEPRRNDITIIIAGPVASGKSAIAGEIEIALRAIGVEVRFANGDEMRSEKNMTHADWQTALELYNPRVSIMQITPWTDASAPSAAPRKCVDGCPPCNDWLCNEKCRYTPSAAPKGE
jgi:hypothetical protein